MLIERHRGAGSAATLLSVAMPDPTGYGRVVRGADGLVERIVEQADATEAELAIGEVNSGTYVFASASLRAALPRIGAANAQGERYLTDVVAVLRQEGRPVAAALADDPASAMGINDLVQLAEAERCSTTGSCDPISSRA